VSILSNLIPSVIVKLGMPPPEQFDNEVSRWFNMLTRQYDGADLPDTLLKSLVCADPDIFQNIIILLVLGCTLPATTAEAEYIVSVSRLIKSHLFPH